eukprot:TRINITY_DN1793_c0_g1_i10.p3 TRINITY_DN1793_c0_g1~~TRINITY_DN1793_c0_g1_i10.p3  ORF type:complete len:185 (-),score=33.00 TRINITY_DN1793_c0_g1_i10:2189-2743(-)
MFADTSLPPIVVIATKNPGKIKAVEEAFKQLCPGKDLTFLPCAAPSGVSDQPMTSEETLQGAVNRVKNAKEMIPEAAYWVGIEGGLEPEGDLLTSFGWGVILSASGVIGKAKSATFYLPKEIADLVKEGKELGVASDIVFTQTNCKHSNGAVGLLTQDNLTRPNLIVPSLLLAAIPFLNTNFTF